MQFFHTTFLWFTAGASIPVIIHLLNRQKFRRVRWAAMEWLLAALQKTRRRVQFENLLLLLLRILIMLLVAFAIARPFVTEGAWLAGEGRRGVHYVFAIDVSYSMEYKKGQTSSLDLAKKACLKAIQDIEAAKEDRFTLLLLSDYPERAKFASHDLPQIRDMVKEIAGIRQYGSTMLNSFLEIREAVKAESADPSSEGRVRKVYLFTDMQRNGWEFPEETSAARFAKLLAELSGDKRNAFYLIDVGTPEAGNHAIVDLRLTNSLLTVQTPAQVVATLYNYSSRPTKKRLQLLVNGKVFENRVVALPPATPVAVRFTYSFRPTEYGPCLFEARFDPQDRQIDFPSVDNARYLAVEVKPAVRGLLVDGEPGDGSAHGRETGSLEKALDPFRDGRFFKIEWVTVPNLYDKRLEQYDFLCLANVKSLTRDLVRRLEEFVRRGGGLFLSLGDQIDTLWYNTVLYRECGGRVQGEKEQSHCPRCGRFRIPPHQVVRRRVKREGTPAEEEVSIHARAIGLLPAKLGEIVGTPPDLHQSGVPRRFSKVDYRHMIFSLFEEKLRAQPFGLIFWKYFRLRHHDPAEVIAELDDNEHTPILLSRRLGEGKVVLWGSAIDAEEDWNAGITGRPPYWVMVKRLCDYLSIRSAAQRNFFVGEPLRYYLPYSAKNEFLLHLPEGTAAKITADHRSPDDRFMEIFYGMDLSISGASTLKERRGLKRAGAYTLVREGAAANDPPVAVFAANLGPRSLNPIDLQFCEGNLERLSREDLKALYPDFNVVVLGEKSRTGEDVELRKPKREFWRSLLWALLGFLLAESLLAAFFGRTKG